MTADRPWVGATSESVDIHSCSTRQTARAETSLMYSAGPDSSPKLLVSACILQFVKLTFISRVHKQISGLCISLLYQYFRKVLNTLHFV